MVKPFSFAKIPRIIFKSGGLSGLPGIIESMGKRIIFVTGENSFLSSPRATLLFNDLSFNKINWKIVKIPGEPSPEMIDNAVRECSGVKADLVVAAGGGSVLDAGKAVSAMLYNQESVTEFLEGVGSKEHPGTKIPFIAMPTTAGTGSEATKNAVISRIGAGGFKRSLRHDNFVPDIALVDPELTIGCPPGLTAASGMDCFTQLVEAYLSVQASEYTDALALEGLKALKGSLTGCYNDGENIGARSGMAFAALTSGICLANAGLGVVHGFASTIGGLYNIPHGVICGTLMAAANEINVRKLKRESSYIKALEKYVHLGKLFLEETGKTDDYYIDGFIRYLYDLSDELHLPGLRTAGVDEQNIGRICSLAENKNNPVRLSGDDLSEIVYKRYF
jgi:alcohol dehydrogenase class IV